MAPKRRAPSRPASSPLPKRRPPRRPAPDAPASAQPPPTPELQVASGPRPTTRAARARGGPESTLPLPPAALALAERVAALERAAARAPPAPSRRSARGPRGQAATAGLGDLQALIEALHSRVASLEAGSQLAQQALASTPPAHSSVGPRPGPSAFAVPDDRQAEDAPVEVPPACPSGEYHFRTSTPLQPSPPLAPTWPWPRYNDYPAPAPGPTPPGDPLQAAAGTASLDAGPSPPPGAWPHGSTANAAYASAPMSALPSGGHSLPLGDHLLPATRDRITRGEYVDVFSLLNREQTKEDKDREDDRDKELARRRKPPRTWANWLPAFLIYASVSVRAHPELALQMLQYIDIIYRAYVDFPGSSWLAYDEEFRMRRALHPDMRWDEPHQLLWLQYMTPSRPVQGDRFHCGHLVQRPAPGSSPRQPAGQAVQHRMLCWDFSATGRCGRKPCRFRHECSLCSGPHPASSCFRAGTARPRTGTAGPPSRPPPDASPSRKGPQPNQN